MIPNQSMDSNDTMAAALIKNMLPVKKVKNNNPPRRPDCCSSKLNSLHYTRYILPEDIDRYEAATGKIKRNNDLN